ncbi:hypothetical protein ASU33_12820 [Solirubrum puertoriconensis]|uniref:Uncharacterized protein n=2 Tax=Solirubrum puertoriconensis TaxID=1751427 RepID=A0A9X0HJT7_SOLP1|nr:hypothetical protein ASU33_12820 [Solirubrum puertoriconensis]
MWLLRLGCRAQLKAVGGVFGMVLLTTACSDDRPRDTAGQQREPVSSPSPATSPIAETDDYADDNQQVGPGSWFRVVADRAYFFDAPRGKKPNGRYLLRGDVLYADDVVNRYVKTSFKQPNGATATGWLKAEDLGRLARKPEVAIAQPNRAAQRPRPSPQPTKQPDTYSYELEAEPSTPTRQPSPAVSGAATAVVAAERSYFYNSPDLTDRRKAHCVRGDKVRLGEEQGEAVYVTFTNWQGVTSRGWMRKDALQLNR